MIDMHVHLERGPYTKEWLMEFVSYAQKKNIDELYLLEHSSRFVEFRNLYDSIIEHKDYGQFQSDWLTSKMKLGLSEYKDFITDMRQYKFPIEVKFGLEICYFPEKEEEIKKCVNDFDWDFLTGSIHWIDGWGFDHSKIKDSWEKYNVDKIYERYYRLMIQLVESRIFDVLAHPDSIKCFGYYPNIRLTNMYNQLAEALLRNNVKAEFSSGLYVNYGHEELGLNRELLKILSEYEVDLVTASDAHRPEDVGKYIKESIEILRSSNK